jgi:hypothetical protein
MKKNRPTTPAGTAANFLKAVCCIFHLSAVIWPFIFLLIFYE